MTKLRLCLAALAAVSICVLALALRSGASAPSPTARPSRDLAPASQRPRITYAIDLIQRMTIDPGALGADDAAPTRFERRLDGTIEQVLAGTTAHGEVWLLRVVSGDDAAVRRGVLIERDPRGRALAIRLPEAASRDAVDRLQQLAGLLQVAAPERGTDATWALDELGPEGALAVTYDRDGDELRKRITGLPRPAALAHVPRGLGLAGEASGELAITRDAHDWRAIAGSLRIAVLSRGGEVVLERRTELEVTVTARDVTAPPALDGFGPWQPLDAPVVDRDAARARLEASLEGASWDQLRDALSGAAELDDRDRAQLARRIAAYLELHPEACDDARAALLGLALADPAARIWVGALGIAGSDEAQAALGAVAEAWLARGGDDGRAVVAALGQLPSPTPTTIAILERIAGARDPAVAATAALALGSAAEAIAYDDPDAAAAIAARFADELAAAPAPERAATLLDALGNSGAPATLDAAAPYLADADPTLRGSAAFALRFVDGAGADAALAEALRAERHPAALLQTLLAIELRRPSPALHDALAARGDADMSPQLATLASRLRARGHASGTAGVTAP